MYFFNLIFAGIFHGLHPGGGFCSSSRSCVKISLAEGELDGGVGDIQRFLGGFAYKGPDGAFVGGRERVAGAVGVGVDFDRMDIR